MVLKIWECERKMDCCNINIDNLLFVMNIRELILEDIVVYNDFLFFIYGVVLFIIICIGILGNFFVLVILMYRFLLSFFVSIVKVLIIYGIVNMCFLIYLEIILLIRLYMDMECFDSEIFKFLL